MNYSPAPLGGAVLLLLLAGGGTRANPVQWQYRWSNTPDKVWADEPGLSYFTVSSDADYKDAYVNSEVMTVASLRGFSTADPLKPDHFSHTEYTMVLHLLDVQSNTPGTLTFKGELDGDLSATASSVRNRVVGPTQQSIQLGAFLYTVTLPPFSLLGPPPDEANPCVVAGRTQAIIQVVQTLPEPNTLALGCLGATSLTLVALRRRRAGYSPHGMPFA